MPRRLTSLAWPLALVWSAVAVAAAAAAAPTPGSDLLRVKDPLGAVLRGGGGSDRLVGGPGADELHGEWAGDIITGGAGDDTIDGGNGGDRMAGEAGDDAIAGGFGHDIVDGGPGNDAISGDAAPDTVAGGDGDDLIHAGPGGDVVDGGAGNDQLYSDSGPDVITAGDGDDVVHVNTGSAVRTVDCGAGLDTVVVNPYGMAAGPTNRRQLRDGRITGCERVVEQAAPVDPLKGIWADVETEEGATIVGTPLNDRLFGLSGPDHLSGGDGDDEIWGNHKPTGIGFGTDVLDGGPGNDVIFGGRVRNRISGGPGDDDLQNGIGANRIRAGDGDDRLVLRGDGRGSNVVWLGTGDDYVRASSKGRTRIVCGPGRDTVEIGFNRLVRWRADCERVTTRYRR